MLAPVRQIEADTTEVAQLQRAIEEQNTMLYKMLEKVNEDRERRIREKNQALMRKIKTLERKKRGGGDDEISEDEDPYADAMMMGS